MSTTKVSPALEAEDIKFIKAQETGADTTAIVTEKPD
jgi:hypothetical protein